MFPCQESHLSMEVHSSVMIDIGDSNPSIGATVIQQQKEVCGFLCGEGGATRRGVKRQRKRNVCRDLYDMLFFIFNNETGIVSSPSLSPSLLFLFIWSVYLLYFTAKASTRLPMANKRLYLEAVARRWTHDRDSLQPSDSVGQVSQRPRITQTN